MSLSYPPISSLVSVPLHLAGLEKYIRQGWDAFMENKGPSHNPYMEGSLLWKAWVYGYDEAKDHGP